MLRWLPLLFPSVALAAPLQLVQQGRVVDNAGPIAGPHDVTVAFYPQQTGGSAMWAETVSTTFADGYFAVVLGAATALDDTVFDAPEVWVEIGVGQSAPLPRQRVVSTPYALRAEVAHGVQGGIVDATEIRIGGQTVIASDGSLTGGSLSDLDCVDGEAPLMDGGSWTCGALLTTDDVRDAMSGGTVDLAAGSTLNGAAIATGPHLTTAAVRADLGAASVGLAGGSTVGGAAISTGPHLTTAAVRTDLASGAVGLGVGSTVGGAAISTGAHLTTSDVRADLVSAAVDLHAGSTVGGAAIATAGHSHSRESILGSCATDQILAYDGQSWVCSTPVSAASTVPIGGVITWWRPAAAVPIPTGFRVCDGSTVAAGEHAFAGAGGTPIPGPITLPDLRGRFIRGADPTATDGTATGVGGTGGSNATRDLSHTHALSVTATTGSAGAHTHTYSQSFTTASGGTHVHQLPFGDSGDGLGWNRNAPHSGTFTRDLRLTAYDGGGAATVSAYAADGGAHTHAISFSGTSSSDGAHTHGVTVSGDTASRSLSVDVVPAYTGLLYLMRVK